MLRNVVNPGILIRRLFSAACIFLYLSGCQSSRGESELVLVDDRGALAAATQVAREIEDPLVRADTLAVIGEGYVAADNLADARTVAQEALQQLADITVTSESAARHLRLASVLLRADDTAAARQEIELVLSYVDSLRDEALRAELLPGIIEVAVSGGEETRDLLPAAVDPVYVIEDTDLRARTFISIAGIYQEGGGGQSVDGLIQQTIPAIRSIGNPFRRAQLFAELSDRALEAGNDGLADNLADLAGEQYSLGLDLQQPSTSVVESIARAVTRKDGATVAVPLVSLVTDPYGKAAGYLVVASQETDEPLRRWTIERAIEISRGIAEPADAVDMAVWVAETYLRAGLLAESLRTAEQTINEIISAGYLYSSISALERLGRVYAHLGRTQLLSLRLDEMNDPPVEALVSLATAEALIEDGSYGIADDFLVAALLGADEASLMADTIRVGVVSGLAKTGSYSLAIGALERVFEPVARARAAAILAVSVVENGGLTADQLEEFRLILEL